MYGPWTVSIGYDDNEVKILNFMKMSWTRLCHNPEQNFETDFLILIKVSDFNNQFDFVI